MASAAACSFAEGVGAPTVCHVFLLDLRNSALFAFTGSSRSADEAVGTGREKNVSHFPAVPRHQHCRHCGHGPSLKHRRLLS